MKQTKSWSGLSAVVPAIAWKHLEIEVGKVSRRFALDKDESLELYLEVRSNTLKALADRYDPRKGKVYTFVQRVVHIQLCKWMHEEYRRREAFRAYAVEESRRKARRQQAEVNGQVCGVDDSSYGTDDRLDQGEQLPEIRPNEEMPWEPSGERRLLVIIRVRQAIGRLKKGESKSLLELYLKCETLTEVYERMRRRRRNGLGSARFYGEMWPQAKRDFRREWAVVEKCFNPLW